MALDFEELNDAPAEPAKAEAANDDDLLGFDAAEAAVDALPDIEPTEDNLSFDLTDEPAAPAAKAESPAELSLDDGDLGFELEATLDPAPAEEDAGGDDLGFTLEDLEESPAEMAAPKDDEAGEQDEALAFDLAEPEPEPAPAKAGTKKADTAGKVPLGEEKAPGGDSEMSRFMKELGL